MHHFDHDENCPGCMEAYEASMRFHAGKFITMCFLLAAFVACSVSAGLILALISLGAFTWMFLSFLRLTDVSKEARVYIWALALASGFVGLSSLLTGYAVIGIVLLLVAGFLLRMLLFKLPKLSSSS